MEIRQSPQAELTNLYVIYDADGTFTGEIIYALKKLFGISHCAACDITHGPRKEKPEFTYLKQRCGWNVPLHNIHRDEMDGQLRMAVGGMLPCVAARTTVGDVVLVEGGDLEKCSGSVECLKEKVDRALEVRQIVVPNQNLSEISSSEGVEKRNKMVVVEKRKELQGTVVPHGQIFALESGRSAHSLLELQQEDAVVPGA